MYFGESQYSVDESDGFVEVKVWRTGTDLSKPSSVTVRSRRTDPKSAEGVLENGRVCWIMVECVGEW